MFRLQLSVALLLIIGTALAAPSTALTAPPAKVDICQVDGTGRFKAISLSERALSAHLRHGDALPGDAVPGMDGFVFAEDCTPVEEGPPADEIALGCYGSSRYTDFQYVGPINTPGNVIGRASFGGICTGAPFGGGEAIIRAAGLAEAIQTCESLGLYLDETQFAFPLNSPELGYAGFPSDAWICNVP